MIGGKSMGEILVRYLHFLSLFILMSSLVGEHLLIDKKMDLKAFKKLAVLDSIYGLSALFTLISGLLLWFAVGKESVFYTSNFIFHIKITLFVVIAILSVFPTLYFLRHRNTVFDSLVLPRYIVGLIRAQLTLLCIVPLLAVLMSRGVGLS